jgi:hypothetical protein
MVKCKYFILYPKKHEENVKIICSTIEPTSETYPEMGFSEGSFLTKDKVSIRLNEMNIPASKREWVGIRPPKKMPT